MKKTLLISTTNIGKQAEMLALLKNTVDLLRVPQELSINIKVDETGSTYTDNARLKASAFCKASGLPSLADDSGLEVDALGGAPGLFSARFSPKPNASDADRRALLVSLLMETQKPWKARFVCAMVLVLPDGSQYYSRGICDGEIIANERGECGFGYDPIFLVTNTNLTMAELTMDEKNRISHRARAATAMIPFIRAVFS